MTARDKWLRHSVFGLIALVALAQTLAWRGLYADGAYFLVNILQKQTYFTDNDASRLFTYWVTQSPVVLAIKLGITNLSTLIYLFSSCLIAAPLIFWTLSLWKLKDDLLFWPFVGVFTVIYFTSGFFIIGEYNLCYALSAFCTAMLLRAPKFKTADYLLLAAAATTLVMSYAATMFIGVFLTWLAIRKLKTEPTQKLTAYWMATAFLFATSVCVGTWGFFHPGIPGQKAQALDISLLITDPQFWLVSFSVCIMVMQFFITSTKINNAFLTLLLLVIGANTLGFFIPIPELAYSTRTFCGLLLFALLLFAAWLKIDGWPQKFKEQKLAHYSASYCVIPILVLLFEFSLIDIGHSFGYAEYQQALQHKLDTHTGYIPFMETRTDIANDGLYSWCWTYPSMSLLLRKNSHSAIALNPEYCQKNPQFDPVNALPDLKPYYGG